MVMMGQECWGQVEKDFDCQPQKHELILFAVGGGAITREVGQAAGLGQVMGELMIDSPRHKS